MTEEINGLYNDDGTKIDPELIPTPGLCVTCRKNTAGGLENILCLLNRNDQRDDPDFACGAYESGV